MANENLQHGDISTNVRHYARQHYVAPAKREGRNRFRLIIGDVHRALSLHNRVPLVCNALSSKRFLEENGLRLIERTGPPSGLSTTVTLTYEVIDSSAPVRDYGFLLAIRGAGEETFRELGGGEEFLRAERSAFARASDKRER